MNIKIYKGVRLKVDMNPYKFECRPVPDVHQMYVTSDDPPRMLSQCTTLLVGNTMKDFISITPDQVITERYQPTLF